MHIYLVRHTVYSNPDNVFAFHSPFPLSPEGRKHAKNIAAWFKKNGNLQIPIFTSPIPRALQTAEIIASATDSYVETDVRLIETNCPGLQGVVDPGGESWILEEDHPTREPRSSILKRSLNLFDEKVKEGKDCIFVAHGDVLTILYYHLQKKEMPRYLWGPDNVENILKKGDIVEIEINNNKVVNIKRIKE